MLNSVRTITGVFYVCPSGEMDSVAPSEISSFILLMFFFREGVLPQGSEDKGHRG